MANGPYQKMLWGGESSERVRLEHPGEGTPSMHQETLELNYSRTSLAMDGTLVVVVEMSLSTLVGLFRSVRLGTTSDEEDVG